MGILLEERVLNQVCRDAKSTSLAWTGHLYINTHAHMHTYMGGHTHLETMVKAVDEHGCGMLRVVKMS